MRTDPGGGGRWAWLAGVALLATGCASPHPAPLRYSGRAWTDAEGVFHRDPRWLGADAALSVPLGGGRTVWLFGDTFVATSEAHSRAASLLVRNSIAIQTGADPRNATMTFHWGRGDGATASFFPDGDQRWYWPGHGIRLDGGPLVIFLYSQVASPGQGLGFATTGYALALISNPDAPAESWNLRVLDLPALPWDAIPATAVVADGDHVVALAIRQEGTHAGMLVRYPAARLAAGDVTGAEWWAGDARGWVPASVLGPDGPAVVLEDAGAECSVHWDDRTGSYIHTASYGFGASTIAMRTAPALTGPWSAPRTVYRPPESEGPRPFVYAAKAHPELAGPDAGDLIVTYAANSFEFADLLTEDGSRSLYWPRLVAVKVGE